MRKVFVALALAALGGFAGTATARGDIEGLARTCNNCHGIGGVSVLASAGFSVAVNSYYYWVDLVHRPQGRQPGGPRYDQYFLVCGWRDRKGSYPRE